MSPRASSAQEPGRSFYDRSIRTSVGLGLVGALFATVYAGPPVAGRYLIFLAWMLVNLRLWRIAAREILGPRRFGPLAIVVSVKIVWLATIVFLCGWLGIRRIDFFLAFLLGLNTPFLVMFLKAMGQALNTTRSSDGAPEKPTEANTSIDRHLGNE